MGPLNARVHYRLVHAKLTDRGVFALWLPLHNLTPADYLSVLRTFRGLNRLGIADTMPAILGRLLPGIRADALAERYAVERALFLARTLLVRAKAEHSDDPLERSFRALRLVARASSLAPRDNDITYFKRLTLAKFLDLLAAHYAPLLRSPAAPSLLAKAELAAALEPQNPFVQELLGATLLELGHYEAALGPLEAAVRFGGDKIDYLSNLAFGYDRAGRPVDALRVLKRARRLRRKGAGFLDEAIRRIRRKTAGARAATGR